jgi:hypothetical protein
MLILLAPGGEKKNHAWLLMLLRGVVLCTDKLYYLWLKHLRVHIFMLWINYSFVMRVRFNVY